MVQCQVQPLPPKASLGPQSAWLGTGTTSFPLTATSMSGDRSEVAATAGGVGDLGFDVIDIVVSVLDPTGKYQANHTLTPTRKISSLVKRESRLLQGRLETEEASMAVFRKIKLCTGRLCPLGAPAAGYAGESADAGVRASAGSLVGGVYRVPLYSTPTLLPGTTSAGSMAPVAVGLISVRVDISSELLPPTTGAADLETDSTTHTEPNPAPIPPTNLFHVVAEVLDANEEVSLWDLVDSSEHLLGESNLWGVQETVACLGTCMLHLRAMGVVGVQHTDSPSLALTVLPRRLHASTEERRVLILRLVELLLFRLSSDALSSPHSVDLLSASLKNTSSLALLWEYFQFWLTTEIARRIISTTTSREDAQAATAAFLPGLMPPPVDPFRPVTELEWASIRSACWCLRIVADATNLDSEEMEDARWEIETSSADIADELLHSLLLLAIGLVHKIEELRDEELPEYSAGISIQDTEADVDVVDVLEIDADEFDYSVDYEIGDSTTRMASSPEELARQEAQKLAQLQSERLRREDRRVRGCFIFILLFTSFNI